MTENLERSLHSALASAAMENLPITPETEENCRKIITGELTIKKYIEKIISAARRNDAMGALCIEGKEKEEKRNPSCLK